MSLKDWWPSPTGKPPKRPIPIPPGRWHGRGAIKYKIIGNLGDAHPIDYGGFIVYVLRDRGTDYLEAEVWEEPETERSERTVYRFRIEDDVVADLNWVMDWDRIAEERNLFYSDLMSLAIDPDPMERAEVYGLVGRHHGWENLDSYPLKLTRRELARRWPMYA